MMDLNNKQRIMQMTVRHVRQHTATGPAMTLMMAVMSYCLVHSVQCSAQLSMTLIRLNDTRHVIISFGL